MTPYFEIQNFADNTKSSVPHYHITGKLSDDDFEFCAYVSLNDFVIGKGKKKIPYLIVSNDDKVNRFDERTDEFFTGKQSKIYPTPLKAVFQDKSLALMRQQAKLSMLATAQRMLFIQYRFDYLDMLALILENDVEHKEDDALAVSELARLMQTALESNLVKKEFCDNDLGYQVFTFTKQHIFLNNTQLIIEYNINTGYFLINVVANSLNIRIDSRIAVARYLQSINASAKYFNENRTAMIMATAGVYDKHVFIKDHNRRRFVTKNDVNLSKMLQDDSNPASPNDTGIKVFDDYADAWVYAFKYVPDADIIIGYVSNG